MILDKVKTIEISGVKYYLVSDFLFKSLDRKRGITTVIDKIPKSELYFPVKRGRGAGAYATKDGIIEMVSKMPRFPLNIKNELGLYITKTSEAEVGHILYDFCKEAGFSIETQVLLDKYHIDFVINNKIAIEVNEQSHKYFNESKRYNQIQQKYNLIVFDTSTTVGILFAKILKGIK